MFKRCKFEDDEVLEQSIQLVTNKCKDYGKICMRKKRQIEERIHMEKR